MVKGSEKAARQVRLQSLDERCPEERYQVTSPFGVVEGSFVGGVCCV